MSGVCRQGFDLFNKYQRGSFKGKSFKQTPWDLVWKDTIVYRIGRIFCKVFGHGKTFENDGQVCYRCLRHV